MSKIKAMHAESQAWADARQYQDDFERIAEHGPQSEADFVLTKKALILVAARLRMLAAESKGGNDG